MQSQTRRIPLTVALVAFVWYVCTMGAGVTVHSLPLAAKLAGWDASPLVGQPLVWLLTLPLKLLPAGWVPLAVKLLAAAMAAALLGLLARTIQMLPWDHSWESASPRAAALPVLMAAVVCGLEFNFWQEATSSCRELLDLLLLAGAIWLLLEYQVRRNSTWLHAATVVWGAGMAENWVMLLTLPLFLAAVIWLLRVRFFRWKVILRLALLGFAGFSVYALLPMANGLAPHSPWKLGEAWLASLRDTKTVGVLLYYHFWRGPRLLTMVVLFYFLLPISVLVVRLRDEGTKNKSGVDRFQIWIYRSLRFCLLLVCWWVTFDPTIGPRQIVQDQMYFSLPLLTLDYLNALAAGFLFGNLLLISQPVADRDGLRRSRNKFRWKQFVVPVGIAGIVLIATGLFIRNARAIWRLNFHPLEDFGRLAVKSLPAGHGVVLCDFSERLCVFEAALASRHEAADWLAVDTKELPTVAYRARLERRQPAGWLTDKNRHELTPLETLRLLEQAAQANRMFYLHPSYGYFFEAFYLEPTGTIYEMKLRGKDPLDVPALPGALVAANEQFWTDAWDKDLAQLVPPAVTRSGVEEKLAHYGLVPVPAFQDRVLAGWYSIALDGWGVALQKEGRLAAAGVRLEQALQLNTNNVSAQLSLASNSNLQAGVEMGLADVATVADRLGNPDRLNTIMNNDGPFDEPTVGYLLGNSFLEHGLLVQGAGQLERVRTLAPRSLAPELALAEIYNRLQMPGRGRPLINHLREEMGKQPANTTLDLNLALVDSYSWLLQTNPAQARSVLQSVVAEHPDDPQIANRVLGAYMAFGDLTNALRLADAQLARMPDDITSLNNKAVILAQVGRPDEAVKVLDRLLTLTNQVSARINRALANIANEDFAPAESDLQEAEKEGDGSVVVNFGFALVAQHNHDTNQAIHYLELCLTNSPVGSPLWQQASVHLRMLEPGPGKVKTE